LHTVELSKIFFPAVLLAEMHCPESLEKMLSNKVIVPWAFAGGCSTIGFLDIPASNE
jgi:hypothetical protein